MNPLATSLTLYLSINWLDVYLTAQTHFAVTRLVSLGLFTISNVSFAASALSSRSAASCYLTLCIGSFTADRYDVGIGTGFLIAWIGVSFTYLMSSSTERKMRVTFRLGSSGCSSRGDCLFLVIFSALSKTLRSLESVFFIMFKWSGTSLFAGSLLIMIVTVLAPTESEPSFLLELVTLEFWVSRLLRNSFVSSGLSLLIILFMDGIRSGSPFPSDTWSRFRLALFVPGCSTWSGLGLALFERLISPIRTVWSTPTESSC